MLDERHRRREGLRQPEPHAVRRLWRPDRGFWGSLTVYCPRPKLAISVTVNAASPADPEAVVQRLAEIAG
jgi:hypothetical protein